jgi:hypothetical protein
MAKRNRKNNQNKQTNTSNTSMATKVFVLILAFLMVAGFIFTAISGIIDSCHDHDDHTTPTTKKPTIVDTSKNTGNKEEDKNDTPATGDNTTDSSDSTTDSSDNTTDSSDNTTESSETTGSSEELGGNEAGDNE